MKLKRYIFLMLLLFVGLWSTKSFAQPAGVTVVPKVFNGNVELTTQAQVNAFGAMSYTKITGYLLIRSNDITDLSPLNLLDTIGHSVFIEYNRKLKVLNTFKDLLFIGGILLIDSNTELDSIAGFGKVKMIKGPLVLRGNALLKNCCIFYPLIVGQQGVIAGGAIIEGNKGCKSEKELKQNCDPDSDNDGVDDTEDGCPKDPLKIIPGICGCGKSELDSDRDGTPDCKDNCPLDPLKTSPGDCGCGKKDKDSDDDGVADCKDECPDNPKIIYAGVCGCDLPRILDIKIAYIGLCRDNGTATTLDDTYSADLTFIFEFPPTNATLLVSGDTETYLSFGSNNFSTTHTIPNLSFKADGTLINVAAKFNENKHCNRSTVFPMFAPKSCSSGACDPPGNIAVNAKDYLNGAFFTWNNLGQGIEYELGYQKSGSTDWQTFIVKSSELFVSNLELYTKYNYRIRSRCEGSKLSDYATGSFTTGGPNCEIFNAQVYRINCHDNHSPEDASDDYFSFDLFVEGVNTGSHYLVSNVHGQQTGNYKTSTNFRTATGILGKGDVEIVISDAKDASCEITLTVKDPGVCTNECEIQYISIENARKCNDKGSPLKTSDDFFVADLTVYFSGAPSTGVLKLTGDVKGNIAVEHISKPNSHTFYEVKIPASGNKFKVGATFPNGFDCVYTTEFTGILLKDGICNDACNILNAQILNLQCVDNETPTNATDDYLSFELVINGVNLEGNYIVEGVLGNYQGVYGQPSIFRTASGVIASKTTLKIRDSKQSDCNYTLVIEKNSACFGGNFSGIITTGDNGKEKDKITLFPNPANSNLQLNFQSDNKEENLRLEIFDLLGRKVLESKLNGNNITLPIEHFNKGIYQVVLYKGDKILTEKFVKQ